MAQTAAQKASVAATVAKRKAENAAKSTSSVVTPWNGQGWVVWTPTRQQVEANYAAWTAGWPSTVNWVPVQQTVVDAQGKPVTDANGNMQYTEIPNTQSTVETAATVPVAQQQAVTKLTAQPTTVASWSQPDFQDNSDKRLKEIQMNLDKAAKSNPDMFANRATFNQSFSYNDRSQQQKAVLDSYFNSRRATTSLAQTQASDQAQVQKTLNTLGIMTGEQLVDKGLSDQEKVLLQQNNPELYSQYLKAYDNKSKLAIVNGTGSKGNPFESKIQELLNKVVTVPNLQEQMRSKIDALKPQQDEVLSKKEELTAIEDEMDSILADTRKELEGSGATDSYIRALASKRQEEILPTYKAKLREYNALAEQYNTASANIDREISLTKDQYTMEQQAQSQQMQTLGFAMDLMSYQTPQQKADMERQQFVKQTQFTEGDVTSKDPVIQQRGIKAWVQSFMRQYDWLVKSTESQLITRIQNDMSNGKTYQEAMNAIMEDLKQNANYGSYMDKRAWYDSKPFQIWDVTYKQNRDGSYSPVSSPSSSTSSTSSSTPMTTKDLITKREWFRDKAYQDSAWVWTIGYWFTNVNWQPVKSGDTMDRATADVMLDEKIGQYQNWSKYVTANLSESQKAALTSFEYNLGSGIRQKSAKNILDMVNAGNFRGAWDAMKAYNKAGGNVIQWLVNRRNEEANLIQQIGSKSYTDTQVNLMSSIDVKNPTKLDVQILAKSWLTLEDVYNFNADKKSNRWSTWLSDKEIAQITDRWDGFAKSKTAVSFNKIQEAYNFASKVNEWDKATDNQALIYAFAKAMDPDSVVREGEYSTVQKYSQTRWDQFNMNINRAMNGQEFISQAAKKNMLETIKSKYSASAAQYELERANIVKRVNDYAGRDIWSRVVPSNNIINKQNVDYSTKYQDVFNNSNSNWLYNTLGNPYLNMIQ